MVKLLVAGDVKGSVSQLLAKVAQYHKSGAGPFDMVFVVGPLTSSGNEAELAPILEGKTPPAVPVYFFEPGGSESLRNALEELPSDVKQIAENLFYLGRGGIKTVGKLTVAFLGASHTSEDLDTCRRVSGMAGYGGADVFLSTEWGRGMEVDLPDRCFQELSAAGIAPAAVGSEAVSEAAVAVRPRYHFAASEGAFFQRPPYRNYASAAATGSGGTHTTRFIGLGELAKGSAAPKDKTKKWVHALNLEPIAFMKKEELLKRSADTTDCPYVTRKALGGVGGGGRGRGGGAQGGGDKAWASRISAQEDGRRADSGMFFWGGRGGGGGGGGGGRGGRGGGGGPSGPIDPSNCTVFVGNLRSGEVTATQLEALFRAVGPLVGVRISPGSVFGFVEFERHQDAARAISSMEGFAVGGDQMRLTWGNHKRRVPHGDSHGSSPYDGRGGGGGGRGGDGGFEAPVDPENTNVFIGNLPKVEGSVTVQDLREAFVSAGCKVAEIVEVRLTLKGFAFVEFTTHEVAAKAIESMHDKKIKNFNVSCKWGKGNPSKSRQGEANAMVGADGGGPRVGKPGHHEADPRQECWFCLASPQLEDHLVCSVADEVYLAQPKGGLVPGHVLIVPVSHQQRYSELSEEGATEAERYKESFSRYCYSCACEPFFFERCVPTKGAHHLHIQAVPIPSGEASRGARILMRSEGTRHGMSFQDVSPDEDLRATLKDGQYFFAELPGDVVGSRVRLVHRVAEGGNTDPMGRRRSVPLQFGRDVAARLLSMPERAHWRDCALPKAKEILQAEIFKEAFQSFDFTQTEEEQDGDQPKADEGAQGSTPSAGGSPSTSALAGAKRAASEVEGDVVAKDESGVGSDVQGEKGKRVRT